MAGGQAHFGPMSQLEDVGRMHGFEGTLEVNGNLVGFGRTRRGGASMLPQKQIGIARGSGLVGGPMASPRHDAGSLATSVAIFAQ
jgi:hypothetical protein